MSQYRLGPLNFKNVEQQKQQKEKVVIIPPVEVPEENIHTTDGATSRPTTTPHTKKEGEYQNEPGTARQIIPIKPQE